MGHSTKGEFMRIVRQYGTMWARNKENIASIPRGRKGVYVLFDGSMPMYAGKGNIRSRIKEACRCKGANISGTTLVGIRSRTPQ